MEHLFIYLRKSRDEEHDPEILAKHRAELLRLAEHDGFSITADQIHEEIGSADHIESRPVFRNLLSLWERLPAGISGRVWTTEVSRLTRGLQSQQGRVQDALARAAILHRTRARWYDLRLPDDCTAWELEGFISRLELRIFKARIRAAWDEMLLAGLIRNGQAPYGYRWLKGEKRLVEYPGRFEILVRCCREALEVSVKELSRQYAVPENTLLAALKNPVICGWPAVRHGPASRERPDRKEYRLLPREEWRWPEQQNDHYPHACTREAWEALQLAIAYRRKSPAHTDYRDGWCRDVVWFPQSPGPCRLSVYTFPRAPERSYPTYERRPPGEKQLYIARAVVHAAAYHALGELFANREFLAEGQRLAEQAEIAAREQPPEERFHLQQQLAAGRRRFQEAVDAEMDADEPNHRLALRERRQRLQQELERLQVRLAAVESQHRPDRPMRQALVALPDLLGRFSAVWKALSGREQRQLVNAALEQIEVTVTPRARSHQREITGLEYLPWIREILDR
jgi:hypothetical protein